ncbi:hypothetical protein B0H14DRAFT_2607175 [Mycena olivaceomarginata]|nr:hypothetical protein B0H14DRAFT_2607175 [Mycena olivaceomarginata]
MINLCSMLILTRAHSRMSSEAAFQTKTTSTAVRSNSSHHSRHSNQRHSVNDSLRNRNLARSSAGFSSHARLVRIRGTAYAPTLITAAQLAVNVATREYIYSLTSFRSKAALQEIGVTVQAAAAIQRMAATTKVVVNAERRFVVKVEHAVPWGGIVQRKGVVPTERFAVALRANRDSNNVGRCRSGGGSGNTPTVKPTTTHPTRATTHEQPDTTPREPVPTTTPEPAPTTTHEPAPTTTNIPTPPSSIGSSLSTTSTTRSGPTTVPSATAGSENIIIDAPWADVTSSCSSSRKAKACHSTGSDNFNTVKMEYNFTGTSVYVSIASDSARFSISIDGEVTDYGSASTASGAETPGNCTFGWSQTNLTPGTPHVLEIILFGSTEDSMRRAPAAPAPFTLEIQNFVITQNDTTAAAAGGSNAASMTRGWTGVCAKA